MVKFQSLILVLVILVSILISRSLGQSADIEKASVIIVAGSAVSYVIPVSEIKQYSNLKKKNINSQQIKEDYSLLNYDLKLINSPSYNSGQVSSLNYNQIITKMKSEILNNKSQINITSSVVLVRDLSNNINIFELNTNNSWPIASLTKLMTAVIAIEKSDLNKEVTINKDAFGFKTHGIAGGFKSGETFTVEDLIRAMLIISSNNAAVALADAIGPDFIQLMNKKAIELKMFKTNFDDPTGLSYLNKSTVDDLVILTNYIYYNHPRIFEITLQKQEKAEILELNSGINRKLLNINQFAGRLDFIGGKTGYIKEAGENLLSLFSKQERLILIIVLGSENRFKDTEELLKLIK